jgi:hypothetical protein
MARRATGGPSRPSPAQTPWPAAPLGGAALIQYGRIRQCTTGTPGPTAPEAVVRSRLYLRRLLGKTLAGPRLVRRLPSVRFSGGFASPGESVTGAVARRRYDQVSPVVDGKLSQSGGSVNNRGSEAAHEQRLDTPSRSQLEQGVLTPQSRTARLARSD